ncbi:hypothetical protein BU15DRAFT_52355, partial [Melanogaster broomeanus]
LLSDILQGNQRIVSFPNVVIGCEKGITAGVLSALNFARVAFAIEATTRVFSNIIGSLCTKKTIEKSLAICHDWSDGRQLEVEDVYQVPLFERSLKLASTKYGRPSRDWITPVLQELQTAHSSAAIVMTRSPEVVACLRLRNAGPDVFVIFNPRPASDHPQAASVTFSTSLEQTVHRLCTILHDEKYNRARGDLNWQARLLANCSGYVFLPRTILHDALASEDSVIASSLAVLSLHAELSMLKLENRTLTTQNQRFEESVLRLEEELKEEKTKAKRAQLYKPPAKITGESPATVPRLDHSWKPASSSSRKAPLRHLTEPSTSRLPAPNALKSIPTWSMLVGCKKTFDAEHIQLLTQTDQLRQTAQRQFHCGICLDDIPEDDVVHVESCGHDLCRGCTRSHVCAKIDERRFPVLCPLCMADHGNPDPGSDNHWTVSTVTWSLMRSSIETWVEMEMVQFSVLVNCRKCHSSAFVDKFDLEAADEVRCPSLGCDHVWCKKCQQSIDAGGPKHSCDGASELDHLMKQQGWKYCPSEWPLHVYGLHCGAAYPVIDCKTPIQKQEGCNHMSVSLLIEWKPCARI